LTVTRNKTEDVKSLLRITS